MCNKSSFNDAELTDAPQYVDYSGWQFNFYKSERSILAEETNLKDVRTTELREPVLSID